MYHNFERNEIRATVFLKWTDFSDAHPQYGYASIFLPVYTLLLSLDKFLIWVHNFAWSSSNIWAIHIGICKVFMYSNFMLCNLVLLCFRNVAKWDAFNAKNKSSMSKRPISCFYYIHFWQFTQPFNLHPVFWKSRSWEIKVCFKPYQVFTLKNKLGLYYKPEENPGGHPEKFLGSEKNF